MKPCISFTLCSWHFCVERKHLSTFVAKWHTAFPDMWQTSALRKLLLLQKSLPWSLSTCSKRSWLERADCLDHSVAACSGFFERIKTALHSSMACRPTEQNSKQYRSIPPPITVWVATAEWRTVHVFTHGLHGRRRSKSTFSIFIQNGLWVKQLRQSLRMASLCDVQLWATWWGEKLIQTDFSSFYSEK